MPITPFLQHRPFDPETIQAMSGAFTDACKALGLAPDHTDPITELVARHIIELAQRGIRTNPHQGHASSAHNARIQSQSAISRCSWRLHTF
jgi:hypothetical protein